MGFVSNWAQGVIVAVIIATVIEMLVPSNSNGKYVKVVVGVFILFSIISPVINKMSGNSLKMNEWNSYIDNTSEGAIATSAITIDNDNAIKKIYMENLKVDIKSKVSQKGYTVGDVNIDILNNDDYTLNKIEIKIVGKSNDNVGNGNYENTTTIIENIENIKISLGGSGKDEKKEEVSILTESEKRKLKEYLSGVYDVNESNIVIT